MINTAVMRCPKRIAGLIKLKQIRENFEQEQVLGKIKNKQLNWYGHIMRLD